MRVVVAGTFVTSPVANQYYGFLANELGASIECLSLAGVAHTEYSIRRIVKRIENCPTPVTLIGHSQGGLVSVLVGLRYPHLVEKVVSICGPLKGTPLAPGWVPGSTRCMSEKSYLSEEILSTPWPTKVKLTTIGACWDALVPWTNAILPGYGDYYVMDKGHTDIVRDPELTALLAQNKVL